MFQLNEAIIPRENSNDLVGVYCRWMGGLRAQVGWWMWRFIINGLWMWTLLFIDVTLQHLVAWNHGDSVGCSKSVKHTYSRVEAHSVFVFCSFLFQISLLPTLLSVSFSFFPLLPLPCLSVVVPKWHHHCAAVLGVVMWKWRRGKWVAGTSRWYSSGRTAVTKATLAVCCVLLWLPCQLWCPTATVRKKIERQAVGWACSEIPCWHNVDW